MPIASRDKPEHYYNWAFTEILRRTIQLLLSFRVFSIPGFNSLKVAILRIFFNIGRKTSILHGVYFESHHAISKPLLIGSNVAISENVIIDFTGGIVIGNEVWISPGAAIYTHDHIALSRKLKNEQNIRYSSLEIGEDAWIGTRAIILPSVRKIGQGAIIGAGSVVTQDINDWEIVIGNPAKKIWERSEFSRESPPKLSETK